MVLRHDVVCQPYRCTSAPSHPSPQAMIAWRLWSYSLLPESQKSGLNPQTARGGGFLIFQQENTNEHRANPNASIDNLLQKPFVIGPKSMSLCSSSTKGTHPESARKNLGSICRHLMQNIGPRTKTSQAITIQLSNTDISQKFLEAWVVA